MDKLCANGSWLSKSTVNGWPASATRQVLSKAVPEATISRIGSPSSPHPAPPVDVGGGVGLGAARRTPPRSAETPTRRSASRGSNQARKTEAPSSVTATDGVTPPSVWLSSSSWNRPPSPVVARWTPSASSHPTQRFPSPSTATPVVGSVRIGSDSGAGLADGLCPPPPDADGDGLAVGLGEGVTSATCSVCQSPGAPVATSIPFDV